METIWSNTALVAYSLLPKIINSLDFALKNRVNSCFQSIHLKMGVSNEQLIGEILEINDEKRKFVNLAYIVRSTLERLSQKDRQIIDERIFQRKGFRQIAEDIGVALRTVFRRLDMAKERFGAALNARGYDDAWFEKEYGGLKQMTAIKRNLQNDKLADDEE